MVNRLKELRERAGLTQQQLADLIGTSPQQASRLERGNRKLSPEWISKLAGALGVRPGALIEDGPLPSVGSQIGAQTLNEGDEIELLGLWREMEFSAKVAFITLARAVARSPNPKVG